MFYEKIRNFRGEFKLIVYDDSIKSLKNQDVVSIIDRMFSFFQNEITSQNQTFVS